MIAAITQHLGYTVGALARYAAGLRAVSKTDLARGDWVVVTTRNSTYSIHVVEDGLYSISGGWVDQQGVSPLKTTISGCTWGGTAIKSDLVAACGLHLEFGKRVITSMSPIPWAALLHEKQ